MSFFNSENKKLLERIERLEKEVIKINKDLQVNLKWKQQDRKDLDLIKEQLAKCLKDEENGK